MLFGTDAGLSELASQDYAVARVAEIDGWGITDEQRQAMLVDNPRKLLGGMTVTIAAIHTPAVSLNAHPDLVVRGAKGAHDRSDFLLVRVVTSDGAEGYGEVSATPIWSGEDGESADHFIRTVLEPVLVGTPLVPVGVVEQAMDRALAGNPFTKAGVSIALWDAYARGLDVPLAVALGGPYRTEVPIKLSLSGDGAGLERVYAAARRRDSAPSRSRSASDSTATSHASGRPANWSARRPSSARTRTAAGPARTPPGRSPNWRPTAWRSSSSRWSPRTWPAWRSYARSACRSSRTSRCSAWPTCAG